ncbi:MAG: hypothetical protein UT48_C0032G0009 [Parcubacteria group bacterium GW2011_GWE2_39_37]|uniref:Glycine transporter domain-containing protein n=1 Tax=Candidatus Falkowbacteria bacterium GW2011_GWF2_39_8 TaxID=1618642 RepID=A0A0G0SGV2_9BACT|nr:MAG: hypothetical protein UT48_C0032G0009 [Parcubacteria group bacterium GW2011_GWE2_39_37]KKR33930.1 MAG: hypothetical protein UT64_C0001G0004 [Candidatus Falkowbacteria bacterium GW2011_GWF2_39_8]
MINEILILDLIGTFAFASYGSYFAIKKDFDLFGIFVCAFLTAVGGGTIRELILNHVPFYFFDEKYIATIIIGIIFTILFFKKFQKINSFMLVLDAIGLVVFALIGANHAVNAGLGLFAVVFFAVITSVGGGLIRDMVMNEVPEIMHRDLYASVAIVLGAAFWYGRNYINSMLFINILLAFCFALRMSAITFKINLWKPAKKFEIENSAEF